MILSQSTAELVEDEDSFLGTDSKSEILKDDDSSFINHDSDLVSVFGNGKSLNCAFFAIFNRIFYFCRN